MSDNVKLNKKHKESFMRKSLKESRAISFATIFFIYILAAAVGIIVYYFLPLYIHFAFRLFIADFAATVFVFIFSVILKNASVYDPYWSVQPIVIAAAYFVRFGFSVSALFPLIAVCLWGVRLTANWAYTFKNLTCQDWRYSLLKEQSGKWYPLVNFIGIHLVPTIVVYACILPVTFIITERPAFNAISLIFFAVSVCAMLLQLVADTEMHAYRENRPTPFIGTGLWKYSRHPNYLGEILMWWGIGFYAFTLMTDKWYLLLGALLNTVLFLVVSIPMADRRQAQKEGFDEYKSRTRILLPLPKRAADK